MEFPDTIEGFGYEFSKDGKLQQIDTGEPFEFVVKEDDHSYNQKRYEALGELITPVIYNLLEERCGLKRYPVPIDAKEKEPSTFIFCSEKFSESEKLLILIHGSGVVRAGQWARRLIINDSLNSGTQIPFIERGIKEGYGILVMNTNDNHCQDFKTRIRGSESPESHGKYVWENYVRNCKAKKIAVIAHSYGGVVATSLYKKYKEEFEERVFAVALTDSVHFVSSDISYLIQIGRNWVTNKLPLDTPVSRRFKDIPCVSAGCLQHEMTSWSSFDSIFGFFYEKLLPVSELAKHKGRLPCTYFSHSISSDEEVAEGGKELGLKTDLKIPVEVREELDEEVAEGREELGLKTDLKIPEEVREEPSEERECLPIEVDEEVSKERESVPKEVVDEEVTERGEDSHSEVAEETTEEVKNLQTDIEMVDELPEEEECKIGSLQEPEGGGDLSKRVTTDEGKETLTKPPSDPPEGERHSESDKSKDPSSPVEPVVSSTDKYLENSLKRLKYDNGS